MIALWLLCAHADDPSFLVGFLIVLSAVAGLLLGLLFLVYGDDDETTMKGPQ